MKGATMKRFLFLAIMIFLSMKPASAQTNLTYKMSWSSGAFVHGTLVLEHSIGTDSWMQDVTTTTFTGIYTVKDFVLKANTLYRVVLKTHNPSTGKPQEFVATFIVPSWVLNPAKIISAIYKFEVRIWDNTVVPGSTTIVVGM
jgi:hypothetical protein